MTEPPKPHGLRLHFQQSCSSMRFDREFVGLDDAWLTSDETLYRVCALFGRYLTQSYPSEKGCLHSSTAAERAIVRLD
jgi:hypothetical protein